MTGKYGMFDTEAERDAFVAARDRHIAQEAEQLKGIGIKDADDLVNKYARLCDLFERVIHGEDDLIPESDDFLMTSDEARSAASRVLEIMQGEE